MTDHITRYVRPVVRAMQGYKPGLQLPDAGIIKLNTNENPYPPSPRAVEAIRHVAGPALRRYPDAMAQPFREAAARVLAVDPDWILAGFGCDDILTILVRTFVDSGGIVAAPAPSYVLYKVLADIQGAEFRTMSLLPDWQLAPDDLIPGASLTLLVNPNSPSGTAMTPAQVSRLAAALDGPLVVDEAYADFADANCLDLVRRLPNVIIARSMSKGYALAGARFGYCVARPELIAELVKVKDSYNVDMLSLAAATAAISDQEYSRMQVARVRATRGRLIESLRALDWSVLNSAANFVWAEPPEGKAHEIYEALKKHGVLVRYMNYEDCQFEGLRISVGTDDEIDTLLDIVR